MLLLWPSLSILPFTPSRPWPCPFLVSCLLIPASVASYSIPMVPLAFLLSISIPCPFPLFFDLLSGWLLLIPLIPACQVIHLIKLELPILRRDTFRSAHVSPLPGSFVLSRHAFVPCLAHSLSRGSFLCVFPSCYHLLSSFFWILPLVRAQFPSFRSLTPTFLSSRRLTLFPTITVAFLISYDCPLLSMLALALLLSPSFLIPAILACQVVYTVLLRYLYILNSKFYLALRVA